MPVLPSSLSLTSIADGALAVAADLRNDFAAIQTWINTFLGQMDDGLAGQYLGGVGTTISYSYPPGYDFSSYTEFVADKSVTATTSGTADTVVTAPAVTFDGSTAVFVEFHAVAVKIGTSNIKLELFDGATSLGLIVNTSTGGTSGVPVFARRKLTPSAAAHTYSVKAYVDGGTGTVYAAAGGSAGTNMPGYIRITKA